MPSFVCDTCQETLKKPKLDIHAQRCRGASFSCIDCYKSFKSVEYRSHFSCITEVEKYEKKKPIPAIATAAGGSGASNNNSQKINKVVLPKQQLPSQPVAISRSETTTVATSPARTPKMAERIVEAFGDEVSLTLKELKKQMKSSAGVSKKEFKKYLTTNLTFKIDTKGKIHVNLD